MAIHLKEVRSTQQKEQVYQLRHDVFIKEEKRFHLSADQLHDRFDSFNETINFLAYDTHRPVAGIRLVMENAVGLPAEEAFDFSPLRASLTGGCATVGWFCVRRAYRHHPGLVVSMIQMCFRRMRQAGLRHVLAVVHPPALALMRRLVGARALSPEFSDPHLNVGIIPVHVDLHKLPAGSHERFVDPNPRILADSHLRRLYGREETIFGIGDPPTEVFQVLRGVARRYTGPPENGPLANPGSHMATTYLGPGDYFGDSSAIDGMPRVTKVTTHSADVDLMVWGRTEFLKQLSERPDRALAFCRMTSRRLRRVLMPSTEADPSFSLAARLLLEASARGRRPVNVRWLAGQCGIDRKALSSMVSPWEKAHLISADDRQRQIWVIDQSQLSKVACL